MAPRSRLVLAFPREAVMDYRVSAIVRRHAAERPEACALSAGEETISWAALDERSSRVAQALVEAGISRGDRIAHLDKNSPEYFELLFGAAKIGAVLVDVNWRLIKSEIAQILADAGTRLLVAGAEFAGTARDIAAEGGRQVLIAGEYAEWRDAAPAEDPGYRGEADEVALQLYTSGTTGVPKGVMLTHANMGTLAGALAEHWRVDQDSVALVAMPLFHIGGSGWALGALNEGAQCVLVRDIVPEHLLELMENKGVTNGFVVPAVLQLLCAVPGAANRDWSALRSLAYGASPITEPALRAAMRTFRCDFIQVYGLTETTGAITELAAADHDPDGTRAQLMRSAGRPYPWVELRIVDPVTGHEQPSGAVGEVWTRSAQNMAGYWDKPEETTATLRADGWLRTGDAGYIDAGGYLFLTDRIKDMIVSGGENVYPIEIENVLADHPDVAEVAVIGVPDERFGEVPHAVVVTTPGHTADPDAILRWARDRLAPFKLPRALTITHALPRNPSGKVLKRELRAPYWTGRDRSI